VLARGRDARRLEDAGAQRRDDMKRIVLGDQSVDPAEEPQPEFETEAQDGARRALAVAQFVGPTKRSWLRRVRDTGVRVVSYVPENAYLVSGRERQLARLTALAERDDFLRAVTEFEPRDKLAEGGGDTRSVAVQTHRGRGSGRSPAGAPAGSGAAKGVGRGAVPHPVRRPGRGR